MKRGPNQPVVVRVLGASARAEIAEENDRAGNRSYIEPLSWPPMLSLTSVEAAFSFSERKQPMPSRGPQTFKKRQKEQQRKERQQEKVAKRLASKREGADAASGANETAVGETAKKNADVR
jgi:hypothetical protein